MIGALAVGRIRVAQSTGGREAVPPVAAFMDRCASAENFPGADADQTVVGLPWRLPLADLVAFSHLQFSQIRGRQPYSIVRKIPYLMLFR
jgi:hypothetical protein